ncbi:IS3 family transposase, OrfA [Rhizobium phaseoli Ch24-10]|nr:IS3 family transposase, OrfA [Rhizobium phaseoli Ch24-10]
MKKSRFSEAQIMAVLRQAEGGMPVPDLCREHGISTASFYKWRAKYGGMDCCSRVAREEPSTRSRRLSWSWAISVR